MTSLLANPLMAVVIFIGLLIFVHELGHFTVGKLFGIGVETFSIGFGPELVAFTFRGTRYRIALIPLGGYVKFAGALPREEVAPQFRGKEMYRASLGARAATLFAGPFANILLAVVVYTGLGLHGISHHPAIIGQVKANSPAELAGLHPEDKVVAVDGSPINTWEELHKALAGSPGKELTLQVERAGQSSTIKLTPEAFAGTDQLGRKAEQGRAGVAFGRVPAIITLIKDGQAAKQAGLRTGATIAAVNGTAIASWHDLRRALYQAFTSGDASLQVEIADTQQTAIPDTHQSAKISLDAWKSLRDSAPAAFAPSFGDLLAAKLGLASSQLTIAKAGSQAEAVLLPGDRIVAIKGEAVSSIFDLSEKLSANKEATIPLTVERNFEQVELEVPLEPVERQEMAGKATYYTLDATLWGQAQLPPPYIEKYDGLPSALAYGVRHTLTEAWMMVKVIASLVVGKVPLQALGGPILIAKVAQDAMELGISVFLTTLALISINLGLMNLFPIPVADGGQLVLLALEAIKGKPLSEQAMGNFQRIGFVMLMALVILATYNDLSRFWASLLRGMGQVFN